MWDWQLEKLENWPQIYDELFSQSKMGQKYGLSLAWRDTEYVDVILDGSVARLGEGLIGADYSWYLKRILPPLNNIGYEVELMEGPEY